MNPKEWILNLANMRWQLTYKRNVGPVAKWIRECSPESVGEWEEFYNEKLKKEKSLPVEEHFKRLGERLFDAIKGVILEEIESVTKEDCIGFIRNLVISRTYEGYLAEINTIYEELQKRFDAEIKPAPNEWNRKYFVDYYIEIGGKYIGLQVKSAPADEKTPEWAEKWERMTKDVHKKFEENYGGKVFMIHSTEEKKEIYNKEVIDQIKSEIKRLTRS